MTALPGRWALTMSTPVGRITAEVTFTRGDGAHDGETPMTGIAVGKSETVVLQDIRSTADGTGEHVTWRQSITKPMRLNLEFDVTIQGDEMRGHSRAGRLPRSIVAGQRIVD